MTATFDYNYKRAYKVSAEFKTDVQDFYTGNEQRLNRWTNPRRKWVLDFDKNHTDTNSILAFFEARKGMYEAFNWTWKATDQDGNEAGGDGVSRLVRFDTDTLDISHLALGYTEFSIPFVEVTS